ncbi:hypothetical protein [Haloarchaeobius sp. TZWSO28]|uniref:hypothetical protein n=1 Tax=Haloarchaeobius sp. TZWSO28 TaxID=3446119 RepID=UPI003EB6B854
MDDAQTACAVLFVEAIAEQMVHDKTTIGDVTFDLIVGHHHLNQLVSRRLLEQMRALDLIKPPTIMDRWTRKTKQQIARRTLWGLGTTSKEFLDLAYIRGYERVKNNAGPHAQTNDPRDQHGDPNESIVHRYFVRAGELFYRHVRRYSDVRTYVRLGDLTDVDSSVANRRLDIVAYDANGNITATAEAERHPVESTGVVRDAEAMALVPGDTDWIVYAKPQMNDLLNTLDQQLITRPDEIPGWSKRRTGKPDAMERLRRIWNHPNGSIPRLESEIVTEVYSIDNLRALLNEHVSYIFEPVDPNGFTWTGGDN